MEQLRQHLPKHPIWHAISDYTRASQTDLTTRRIMLDEVYKEVQTRLAVPIIRESQRQRPAGPYLHLNYVGTLYELVPRRVCGLPFNPVLESDFWESAEGLTSLKGLPLFSFFNKDQTEKAVKLLIKEPDRRVKSSSARAVGEDAQEVQRKSEELNAVLSEVLSLSDPPAGSDCDHCWDWLESLGAAP